MLRFFAAQVFIFGGIVACAGLSSPTTDKRVFFVIAIDAAVAGVYTFNNPTNNSEARKTVSDYPPRKRGYPAAGAYPPDWEQLRVTILQRDGHRYGNCGSTPNLHVHHIVPLSKGGSNKPGNLRTLCKDCHTSLHPHMRE